MNGGLGIRSNPQALKVLSISMLTEDRVFMNCARCFVFVTVRMIST